MTPDELAVMDGSKYILQVQGVRPFFSDKYDITKHPQYKCLSDADRYYRVATKTCVVRAISKEVLAKAGLVSCLDYYNESQNWKNRNYKSLETA